MHTLNFSAVLFWFLLAFNAGIINTGGFIACGRFVTHITGFATLFGADIAMEKMEEALGILSIPLFFMLGSFFSGLLIDARIINNKKPHPEFVMLFCSLITLTVVVAGEFGAFGPFGNEYALETSYILLALLCLTSGLQNGAVSTSSGLSIRTTHLTGITTDFGLGLAKLVACAGSKPAKSIFLVTLIRAGTILSFVVGSGIGAMSFIYLHYEAFLIPMFIYLYSAWFLNKAHVNFRLT